MVDNLRRDVGRLAALNALLAAAAEERENLEVELEGAGGAGSAQLQLVIPPYPALPINIADQNAEKVQEVVKDRLQEVKDQHIVIPATCRGVLMNKNNTAPLLIHGGRQVLLNFMDLTGIEETVQLNNHSGSLMIVRPAGNPLALAPLDTRVNVIIDSFEMPPFPDGWPQAQLACKHKIKIVLEFVSYNPN